MEEREAEDKILAEVEKILSKAKEDILKTMDRIWSKYGLEGAYWGYDINLRFKLYDTKSGKTVVVEESEKPLVLGKND